MKTKHQIQRMVDSVVREKGLTEAEQPTRSDGRIIRRQTTQLTQRGNKMKTVQYNPGMQITNTDQLAKGAGANYLEVLDNGTRPFIAIQWRRVKPTALPKGRLLIRFGQ